MTDGCGQFFELKWNSWVEMDSTQFDGSCSMTVHFHTFGSSSWYPSNRPFGLMTFHFKLEPAIHDLGGCPCERPSTGPDLSREWTAQDMDWTLSLGEKMVSLYVMRFIRRHQKWRYSLRLSTVSIGINLFGRHIFGRTFNSPEICRPYNIDPALRSE